MNSLRMHGLDFSRAVLMVLGLFYHAGLIYDDEQKWRVLSDDISPFLGGISAFIHAFRLEAFYLISGIFYLLVFSKGRKHFIQERVKRALIPMLVIGISLNPIMNYYRYNREYDWGIDYLLAGQWMGHLWFLGNLIVYFLISQPISKYIQDSNPLNKKKLLTVLLFLMVCSLLGKVISALTISTSVVFVSFTSLFYYYAYFVMGILAYKNLQVFNEILNRKYLIGYSLSYLFLIILTTLPLNSNLLKLITYSSHFPLALAILSVLTTIGSKESSLIRSFSDASYTVFLLHQPLLIFLYVMIFNQLALNPIVEYLLMIVIVFTISFYTHTLIVDKNRRLKFLLNGVDVKS